MKQGETSQSCTDRGIKHDLDCLSTLLLSQLGFGGHYLTLSHDLSHVRSEVLAMENAEATERWLDPWLRLQNLSRAGSYDQAKVGRNRRHLGHQGRYHPRSQPLFPKSASTQADKLDTRFDVLLSNIALHPRYVKTDIFDWAWT